MRPKNAICLLLALTATAGFGQDRDRVQLEGYVWEPDPSGQMRVLRAGLGTDIDLEADLGIQGDSLTGVRLSVYPSRRTKIRFEALPYSFSGDQVVTQSITFAGQTFSVSERVVSDLDLDYLRAGFAWQFLASDDGRFRAGPMIELKAFDGSASLGAPEVAPLAEVTEDFEAAFGSAGFAVDLEPGDRVHIFGEFSVLVGADEGDQTDLEAGVRVALWGPLHATAGFRSISIEFDDGDQFVDLDLDSVFFGAALRF